MVQASEYLETLFVAVPLRHEDDWTKSYETITDMIVPRSSRKILSDADYALYSVTVSNQSRQTNPRQLFFSCSEGRFPSSRRNVRNANSSCVSISIRPRTFATKRHSSTRSTRRNAKPTPSCSSGSRSTLRRRFQPGFILRHV